jgi:hypothetical protein
MIKTSISKLTLVTLLMLASLLISCKEEEIGEAEDISGLGGDTWVKGPIDQWILDSLTVPYNISAKYKWDQFEFANVTKTLVPPDEAQVIRVVMNTMPKVR